MSKQAKNDHERDRERLPYTSPVLKEFGPVGQLTQAGTQGMTEAGMSSNNPIWMV